MTPRDTRANGRQRRTAVTHPVLHWGIIQDRFAKCEGAYIIMGDFTDDGERPYMFHGLKTFDGRTPVTFGDWRGRLAVGPGLTR